MTENKPKKRGVKKSTEQKCRFSCTKYDIEGDIDVHAFDYEFDEKDRWDMEDIEKIKNIYEKDWQYYDDLGIL